MCNNTAQDVRWNIDNERIVVKDGSADRSVDDKVDINIAIYNPPDKSDATDVPVKLKQNDFEMCNHMASKQWVKTLHNTATTDPQE